MQVRLTLRYIVMVLISTILLFVSAFFVLSYIEESTEFNQDSPVTFGYNLGVELEGEYEGEISLSEEAMERLVAEEAWLQVLDEEGYVIKSFNTPNYVADHYSPLEITYINNSRSYRPDYRYEVGKNNKGINFITAIPANDWFSLDLEIDGGIIRQFGEMMAIITGIILLIMGFVFSRRIAMPVKKIINGVEGLSAGNYESSYIEKGLYKPVFKQLNQLASRLQSTELERQKTKEQREKWISNISHDLKTPLSTIKGYSEILADEDYAITPDEVNRYSNSIYEKSLYMEEMIEELRLNEQLMQDGINLDRESVNLVSFVRDIIVDILNRPEYAKRTILFNAGEEELNVLLSKDLMRRAIENLLYNALIHNEAETVVTVNIIKEADRISIEMIDNGRGMNAEELDQLFNRYYRGSNTKNYKGTGLGMSIAKEVIEAHDGEIHVESVLDEGTRINIKL